MVLKNLRWGYDGGGMCCGPVEGATIAEICVTDDDGKNFWISECGDGDFQFVGVSPMPIMDVIIMENTSGVDSSIENAKLDNILVELYNYEYCDPDESMNDSKFAKAIAFARLARTVARDYAHTMGDIPFAAEFAEEYIGKNLAEIELPAAAAVFEAWREDAIDPQGRTILEQWKKRLGAFFNN